MKKSPLIEFSIVIQGEGPLSGIPHFLARTTGCALRCCWGDTPCDSWYTSHKPEKAGLTYEDVDFIVKSNPQIKHMFITGGSPTMHPEFLEYFCNKYCDLTLTLETEGSAPLPPTAVFDYISLSPKMKSSTPVAGTFIPVMNDVIKPSDVTLHEKNRERFYTNIANYKEQSLHLYLKFVYSNPSDFIEGLEIAKALGVELDQVYFMPMGLTDAELSRVRIELIQKVIATGCRYTDRLHVIAYGDKRGV